ncbi:MAG: hypothetical protein OXC46_02610 [Thaumarchaeota archaeon]|nr:hypothetical protein [Nitrososphaerota archaeon]
MSTSDIITNIKNGNSTSASSTRINYLQKLVRENLIVAYSNDVRRVTGMENILGTIALMALAVSGGAVFYSVAIGQITLDESYIELEQAKFLSLTITSKDILAVIVISTDSPAGLQITGPDIVPVYLVDENGNAENHTTLEQTNRGWRIHYDGLVILTDIPTDRNGTYRHITLEIQNLQSSAVHAVRIYE